MSTSLLSREYGRNNNACNTFGMGLAYICAASATVNGVMIIVDDNEDLLTGEQGGPSRSRVNQKSQRRFQMHPAVGEWTANEFSEE